VLFRFAANTVLLTHGLFVVFVVVGGFLAWRWRWLAWAHVPAAVWGALIEFGGWICPLTPLENHFRQLAGGAGYEGGFMEHYLIPLLYPRGLTPAIQVGLGAFVVILNGFAYTVYFRRRHRQNVDSHE
jgi:hypothetical protein